jgi:hypothetical protein
MSIRKLHISEMGGHALCLPKEQGGLGTTNLEIQNDCLINKWLCKLINEDGACQELLRKKYLEKQNLRYNLLKARKFSFLAKPSKGNRSLL